MEKILEIKSLVKNFGDHQVLRDISFQVEKGEVICIIGSSGSGKSTLLRCINFLEQPTSGEILYHGKNAETEWKRTVYHSKVGMVFQSFNLFGNMNALENCVLGQMQVLKINRPDAEKKALHYLEKVGMAAYRGARPAQLSGGQKQRVAIARAFMKNAPIVILDEATSALDNKSEAVVQQAIDNLMKDRTVLVIAHRLSTVKNADKIFVINNGQIVEQGNHDELIALNGEYAALYNMQFKTKHQHEG